MPTAPTERLDIEDDAQRELRLSQLLQRINDNSTDTASSNATPALPLSSSFDFGVRETHAVEPPRELLARLDEFLPQMEAANAELARSPERSADIEQLEDADGQHIEMNLSLGVFDIRRRSTSDSELPGTRSPTASSAHSTSTSRSSADDSSDSSSDDDADSASGSGSDSDASTSVIGGSSSSHRPIRPLPARARPLIVVLGQSYHADSAQSRPPSESDTTDHCQ